MSNTKDGAKRVEQIRFVCRKLGGHWHVDVSQGLGQEYTWSRNGSLVFDDAGFAAFESLRPGAGYVVHWEYPDLRVAADR